MKTKLATVLSAVAALVFTTLRTFAVEPPVIPLSEAGLAGLQVSLTTSGYKFLLAEPETPAAGAVQKPARESFVASALVANRSNTDIHFTFPTPAAAQAKWTFRIFNSGGVQLWQSDADVLTPQVLTDEKLEKRARWKRLIQVPLRIDGKLLDPGVYSLEASIEADKPLGATALFEIALPPVVPEPTKNAGIKGLVLYGPISPVAVLGEPNDRPLAGALVRVEEIRDPAVASPRAPFVWVGQTNRDGRFQVVTPAGKFKVTTTARPAIPLRSAPGVARPLSSATAEVIVEPGKFSEVTLHIDSGIR